MDPITIAAAVILLLATIGGAVWYQRSQAEYRGQRPHLQFGGFGSAAANQAIDGARAARDLRITRLILLIPALDLNESTYQRVLRKLLPSRKLMFPTKSERLLWGLQNSRQLANEVQDVLNAIIHRLNDTVVQRLHRLRLQEALYFPSIGWQGGHRWPSVQAIRERRRMLPREVVVPIMVIPDQPERLNETRDNARFAADLVAEGLVSTTIIQQNGSEMVVSQQKDRELSERDVRGRGIAAADRRLMIALMSLVAASWHFKAQLTPADAIRNMGNYSPMTGFSFGCRHLPNPEESSLKRLGRKITGGRPRWLLEDLETAVRLAVEDALNIHPGNSTVDAEPQDWPAGRVLLITVPLLRSDKGWGQLRADMNNWLRSTYPYLTIAWVSGHGAPEFGAENYQYHVQASCWWALKEQEIPDPIRDKVITSVDMRRAARQPQLPAAS